MFLKISVPISGHKQDRKQQRSQAELHRAGEANRGNVETAVYSKKHDGSGSQKLRLALSSAPSYWQLTIPSPLQDKPQRTKPVVSSYNAFAVLPVAESVAWVFLYRNTD